MCTHGMWGFFESFVGRNVAWYTGLRCWHVTLPGLSLYVLDQIYGMIAVRTWARAEIIGAVENECGVLEVQFQNTRPGRPKKGRYVRVRCPEVSIYEMHPFTLTSDPANGNVWTIHMGLVGDWTKKFRDLVMRGEGKFPQVFVRAHIYLHVDCKQTTH